MSLHGSYDESNVFAQILAGKVDCYKIYEDADCLSFLDLFPQSLGHTLVIPKHARARNILEVDGQTLAKVMQVVQKMSRVLVEELQPDGLQIMQFNGAPAGQTVFHLHMHIIPRYSGEALSRHSGGRGEDSVLKALQQRLQTRIAHLS